MEQSNTTLSNPESTSPLDNAVGNVQLAVFVITFLVGSVGNILVLIIVKGKRSRRSVNDLYIMNLAIADLMFIAFLPIYVYNWFVPAQMSVGMCKFIPPVMTMTYFLSVYTLTFMAVHRCYVILNPFKPDMRHRSVYISIAIIWIISAIFIMPLVVVGNADKGMCTEDWPTKDHKRAYTLTLVILQYVLPLTIITVAYIRIIFDLNHGSASKVERHTQVHQQFRKENLQIVKTLATIVILFAVCLLPGQVCWMMVDFGSSNQKSLTIFFDASVILSALHSCLNPIVYGTLTKQFRREYMRYFLYVFRCCRKRWGYRKHYTTGWNSHTTHSPQENNNKTETSQFIRTYALEPTVRESRV
nr:SIFamide neuropeptide receptor [Haliclona caerulea]